MKKSTKRILSLFLVLMMVVSLFPTAYAAETGEVIEDEGYGSSWEDWDVQPAEEGAPIEEEPTDPFVEEPVEEPAPVEEPVEEPAPVEEPVDEPAPVEDPVVEEEPEVSYPANTFYYVGGSGLRVTVDAPEGAFPADTEMNVSELPAAYVQDVVAASGVEGEVLVAADISFANAEGALQPNGKVKVSITSAEAARVSNVKIVHIGDDNSVEEVEQLPGFNANLLSTSAVAMQSVADQRTLTFEADSFSVYAIIGDVVIEDEEGSFDFETEEYKITVSYTKEAQIPLGTHLVVSQIDEDSEEYANLWKQSLAKLNENAVIGDEAEPDTRRGIAAAVFFDVSLIYEGQKIEPTVPLKVDIKLKSEGLVQIKGEETKVIHFGKQGTELIDQVNVVSSTATPEGMPEGAMVNGFRYSQTGFSVVGVFTTDQFIDFDSVVEYVPVGKLGVNAVNGTRAGTGIAAGKTVEDNNNDGIYELALTVTGASEQSTLTEVVKSNVILVIDTSQSMVASGNMLTSRYTYSPETYDVTATYYRRESGGNSYRIYYVNGAWRTSNSATGQTYSGTVWLIETRLAATRRAAKALVSALLENNDPSDPELADVMEISIIEFARLQDSGVRLSKSSSESALYACIDGFTDSGANDNYGTNWQQGLTLAKNEADTVYASPEGENTAIIFLTDGMPTYYMNGSSQAGNGYESNANNVRDSWNGAAPVARSILWDSTNNKATGYSFYGIFAYGGTNGATYLNNLMARANTGNMSIVYNSSGTATQDNFYNAQNTADLEEAFEAIVNKINDKKGYAGVNIADGVSLGATSTSVAVGGTVDADKMRYSVSKGNVALYAVSISDGTATFTIYDGDTPTTLTTSELVEADAGIPGDTATHYVYKVTKGTGDDAVTYMMAPATIDDEGMVKWDLAGLGILDDGVTYKLAFDVWPNQITYDIAADLNNGIYTSVDAAVAAYQAKEGFDDDEATLIKNALHQNEKTGAYEIYTNYEQSVEYYEAESKTDEEGNVTWTYGEKKTDPLERPAPIPLKGSELPMRKIWEVDLAESELHDLLYKKDGTPTEYGVTLHLWKEDDEATLLAKAEQGVTETNKPYQSYALGWDEDAGKYVWERGAAVAPGMMVKLSSAASLGYDTSVTDKIYSFKGTDYYIIEPGHYYLVSEDGGDLHFELFTEVYHPMIVDGTLYDVALNSDHTVKEMLPMGAVVATNTLKGGLNISKVVSTTQINVTDGVIGGVTQPVDDDGIKTVTDEFTYEIQIWKEDESGNKTAVYTTPDQIKNGETISGSVGYRIFSEPRLEDGSIKYTQKRGAVLTESDRNASLANGIYATIANGVTTITLTMPANGEIRLVNLPSNTKYTVREIVEDGGAYAYAATLSQQKLSDTEVTDGTVSTGNTVSGSVPGNTAAVETYYNWASNFYVYHSSDNTVEKISFADERVKGTFDAENNCYSYEFNIAMETKAGSIYGGYYKAYAKSSGDEAVKDLSFTSKDTKAYTYDAKKSSSTETWATDSGGTAYDGGPNIWVRDDAYTESGLEMGPIADTVYYLKEVPDIYLTPAAYVVYDEVAKVVDEASGKDFYPVMKLYMISFTDDANYADTGFDMSVSKGLTPPTHDVFWGEKITVTKKGEEQDPITVDGLVKGKAGLVTLLDATTLITKNAYYREIPYHVTLDGVKVTSIRQMTVFVRDTTFNVEPGWIKPGMTRTTISKKAAVEVTSTVEP